MKKRITAGLMIREARQTQNISREQLARKVAVSPAYIRNLEYNSKIALSDRLVNGLLAHLKLPRVKFQKLVQRHRKQVRAAKEVAAAVKRR